MQRKAAWESTSAGAGGKDRAAAGSREGASRGASSARSGAAAGASASLPSVEEMHPSWAARVKQQDAIKVRATLVTFVLAAHFPLSFSRPLRPVLMQVKVQAAAAARVHIKFDD